MDNAIMNITAGYVIFYVPRYTETKINKPFYLSTGVINKWNFSYAFSDAHIFIDADEVHSMRKRFAKKIRADGRNDIADELDIGTVSVSSSMWDR